MGLVSQTPRPRGGGRPLFAEVTWLFQAWLFAIFARIRFFALFCGLAFVLFCVRLRPFAVFCLFLHVTAFRTTAFRDFRTIVAKNIT